MEHPWWLFISLSLLWMLISIGTWRTGHLLRRWTPPFNLLLSGPDNVLRLVLLAICAGIGAAWGPGPAALGWRTTYLAQDLVLGLLVGLVLAGFFAWAGQAAVRHWGSAVHDDRMLRCIIPASRGEWPLVLLALLPSAALEEMLFRSLPLGGLAWLIGPAWLLWPLALCFGLLHWPQGGWGVVGATLAAVAFSLLFLATRSIWAPLAAHYTMNVTQVVVASILGIKPARSQTGSGSQ